MSRVLMLAGALLVAGCEVRTLPDSDSTAARAPAAAPPSATPPGATSSAVPAAPAPAAPTTTASSPGALPGDSIGGPNSLDAHAADDSAPAGSAATPAGAPAAAPAAAPTDAMRIEVDVSARRLHVFRDGKETATYPVAVGSPAWPTQRGEWTIKQVIINPAWIPPDETWAEQSAPKDPGAPDNPLGRAQLVYDPPRTIHGTDEPRSVGKPTSHGSLRMTNAAVTTLARQVLAVSGADKGDAWFRQALANRRQKQIVDLPHPVPIRVY